MQSLEELYLSFETFRKNQPFKGRVSELYAPANYLMGLGGKRMRPLLLILSYQLYDDDHLSTSYHAALALEVFHNFSLMHDDIIDASPLRRGQPTVHTKYNTNTAILTGDWMLIHTYELFNPYEPALYKALIQLMVDTATTVCEGQQLDINFESSLDITEDKYLQMIHGKTAILLGAAMKMGGMIAGASIDDQQHLFEAGIYMGLSFQLRDDYLDVFSIESGKIRGGDILQNKKTLLFIHSLSHLDGSDRAQLLNLYASDESDKINKVMGLFTKSASHDYVLAKANAYGDKAFESLEKIDIAKDRKSNLKNLFQNLLNRNS